LVRTVIVVASVILLTCKLYSNDKSDKLVDVHWFTVFITTTFTSIAITFNEFIVSLPPRPHPHPHPNPQAGVIDTVMTDDIVALAFGAQTIIKKCVSCSNC
jgi:hypothetical protein